MKYVLILLVVFSLTIIRLQAQTYSVNDFEGVPIPSSYDKELNEWNNEVNQEFNVSIVNGQLYIRKQKYDKQHIRFNVPTGYLIGEDHGEFGGGLYFEPKNSNVTQILVNSKPTSAQRDTFVQGIAFVGKYKAERAKMIPVKSGNIKDIFEYKSKLYTVEGLAHLSLSFGNFTNINVKNNAITFKEVLKLDDAPLIYTIYEGAIYLATLQRFYIINDWKPQLIADNLFWHALYPNSIAVKDSKHIYLGMRAGYAEVNAENGKVTFYHFKEQK